MSLKTAQPRSDRRGQQISFSRVSIWRFDDLVHCRCFDVYEWSMRARSSEATIFSTLQSGTPETGQVLALLDNMTTIYTGSGTLSVARCSDKVSFSASTVPMCIHCQFTLSGNREAQSHLRTSCHAIAI